MDTHNTSLYKAGIVSLILFLGHAPSSNAEELRALQSPLLRAASVGIEIAEVQADGNLRTLYAQDAGRALMPASTLKLVTTATALTLCGAETRVETTVGYTGTLDAAGCLQGDVVIRGGGDATLASRYDSRSPQTFVTEAAQALKRAGVKHIRGRIIGDGSCLADDGVSPDWTWEDLGNYYAAGLYGLNYGANSYKLILDTSHPGQQPTVLRTEPEVPGLTFENRLSVENYPFDSAYIYGAPHANLRRLEGAVPHKNATFAIQGDLPDPPLTAASALRTALTAVGVQVDSTAESDYTLRAAGEVSPTMQQVCYTYQSAPLREIARQTNVYSQNLLAEMMLRLVGMSGNKKAPATSVASRQILTDYWRRQGLDLTGVRLYDGCGLSPNDRVTARFLVQLLARMRSNEAFVASLPMVGREGTVRNFAAGTPLVGRARLKSGTTKQVVSYAGYVTDTSGRTYVVAVLVNNYDGRAAEVRKIIAKVLTECIFAK